MPEQRNEARARAWTISHRERRLDGDGRQSAGVRLQDDAPERLDPEIPQFSVRERRQPGGVCEHIHEADGAHSYRRGCSHGVEYRDRSGIDVRTAMDMAVDSPDKK